MAATNFTPIILYHTTTASATPSAGNLNNGELAINITDGKLFYKDNGGTVQVIATKGTGTIGGSTTQVQYNNAGSLAGSANFTFNGTTATINTLNLTNALGTTFGGTGLNAYTTGDLVYASGTNTLAKLGIGLNTYILTSTGSVPQWSAPSAVTVATATNLAGGAAGSVPYQSGASTTTFLSIGTQNQVLTSSGTAPQWSSGLTITTLATTGNTTLGDAAADNLTVNATITSNLIFTDNTYDIGASGATRPRSLFLGTNLTVGSLTATRVPYASTGGLLVDSANMTFNGTRLSVADFADASLTSGRVTYATTSGNLTDSANLLYSGTDLTVYGITVGRGAGAVSTNTAVGANALAANTTGSNNTAVGNLALNLETTGVRNAAFGGRALSKSVGGTDNTAIGYVALSENTSGIHNTAVGEASLGNQTTGSYNTAVGSNSLINSTTASNNTAVGYQAGYSNTTAGGITAIGTKALYANTTGSFNTAVGGEVPATQGGALQSNTTGSYNTATGVGALTSNTTASNNSAFGSNALVLNTTGASNTAVGSEALRLNTTASNNTAVGYQAGYSGVTAAQNTVVGFQSLYNATVGSLAAFGFKALNANTTGSENSAFGTLSMALTTTGSYNTAFGYYSLYSNTTGSDNTAIGDAVLYTNTTGSGNTGLGVVAMYSNTTGTNNTALGNRAMQNNTGGSTNTAVGYQALFSNLTGVQNVAIGAGALRTSTTNNNTAVGTNALYATTTGAENSAFGLNSMNNNTTGYYNAAGGAYALFANTTGADNTAFGHQALYSATTAVRNTAVGRSALYSATTGQENTAMGWNALTSLTTGTYNTAYGQNAGANVTSAAGNTFIGLNAGLSTTGANNTFVGALNGSSSGAGQLITTGSKNTILGGYNGNQGGLDIRTASNRIVLSDGDGNPRFYVNQRGDAGLNCSIFDWSSYTHLAIGNASCSLYNFSAYELGYVQNAYYDSAWKFGGSGPKASWMLQYDGNWSVRGTSVTGASGAGITWTTLIQIEKDKTVALQGANQATGTGITFPATQNASSNANTLDDYEEGNWTPTLSSTGTPPTVSAYSDRVGNYTKVGNAVSVVCYVRATITAAGTGTPTITGLPFAPAGTLPAIAVGLRTLLSTNPQGYLNSTESYFANATWVVQTNEYICFSATYQV